VGHAEGCKGASIVDLVLPAPASGAPDLPPLPDASLATGAELNAATFADFVKRLRHHVRGEGVDWHHTADALFTVQSREIIFGIDRDYTDKVAVAIEDTMYFSVQEYWGDAGDQIKEQLEAMADGSYETPFLEVDEQDQWDMIALLDDHTVSGWDERWDYVNSHLTKEAADAFIKRKKHDYRRGMRVYVEAQVYCWEFNAIIKGLIDGKIALAQAAPASPAIAPVAPSVAQLTAQLDDYDNKWTVQEQQEFAAFIARFPNESSQGIISLGSAWKHGRLIERAALAVKVEAQQAGVVEDVVALVLSGDLEPVLMRAGEEEMRLKLYQARQALAAPLPPVVARKELAEVHQFLMGQSMLEGVRFGERHPTKAGAFWWRLNLRAALAKG